MASKNYPMKFTLLICACLLCSGGKAQLLAYSSHPADLPQQVRAEGIEQDLKAVLNEISRTHSVSIIFEEKLVRGIRVAAPPATLTSPELEKELHALLVPHGLDYRKVGKNQYVVVRSKKRQEETTPSEVPVSPENSEARLPVRDTPPRQAGLGAVTPPSPTAMLEQTVTGTVTDENGAALPGVSVLVKGTQRGTTTNQGGSYRLNVENSAATLVFSFVGYVSQEIAVGNRSTLSVVLKTDLKALEEVVVIGYGTVRKSDLTGSVVSLNEKDFNRGANASVDQMIQGRAAGVSVTQSSSEPGGGVSIRIRGTSSINAGNSPLYVVDGLPLDNGDITPGSGIVSSRAPRNPLNSLNPGDIESIEILKDASATAIYGSRGANGVVLITTKKGTKGKFKLNYEAYGGIQKVARTYDVLDARQYTTVLNELRQADGKAPEFTPAEISAAGAGINWQDQILRQASIQNHQLSLSGGGDNNQYYVSFGHFNQQGIVINSGLKRYTGRVNLTQSISDKFKFGLNLTTSLVQDKFTPTGIEQNTGSGVIQAATYYDPTAPIFDQNGRYFQSTVVNLENPVAQAKEVYNDAETNRTFGNAYLEYTILKNLRAKINAGSDRQSARRDSYDPTSTFNGAGSGGSADVATAEASNYLLEATLNFDKNFGTDHKVNLLGGYTYQAFTYRRLGASAIGFPTDAFLTNNIGAGNRDNFNIGSSKSRNQLQSYLARANYIFRDKYLITASLRADGSSRFGAGNKYGYFPSVAASWRLINESFIKPIALLSDLKLRVSYGITGNQEIGNYNSLTLLSAIELAFLGGNSVIGVSPSQVPNSKLRWEKSAQTNIGLDVGLVGNRITASADYFVKNTSDLLLNLPIPATTGFQTSLQNIGSVNNRGFEMIVNTENLVGTLKWSSSFNFSTVRNKVTDLAGLPFILQGRFGFLPDFTILRVGDPANAYYGYEVEGVYQTGDDIVGSAQPKSKPGDLKFRDVNGDGKITPDDRKILGSPFPKFTFGLSNRVSYKGFELDFFFQGSYGNKLFNRNLMESDYPTSFRRNRLAEPYLNRWTPTNPTNNNPSFLPVSAVYGGNNNSRYVEDASYLRLRNLQLRYNFNLSAVKFIQTTSIYLTGQNLLTFTNYSGYDPDVSSYGNSNVRIDYNSYPLARMYMLGINVGF